jgi:hypothetical protein
MLAEKKTLLAPLAPWLTGCKAVLPGHSPFWASASISVPGAPASSLATGSQVLMSNPGVEICAPVWVATALLCTAQPPEPRLVTSLAPVSDGEPTLALIVPARLDEAVRDGTACAVNATHRNTAAETPTVARLTTVSRMARLMATPVPRRCRERWSPPYGLLVRILSKRIGIPVAPGCQGSSSLRCEGPVRGSRRRVPAGHANGPEIPVPTAPAVG